MAAEEQTNRLRRLRVLQALARAAPDPMGEMAILHAVRVDPALSPTLERVQPARSMPTLKPSASTQSALRPAVAGVLGSPAHAVSVARATPVRGRSARPRCS